MICEPAAGRVVLGRTRDQSGEPFWAGLDTDDFLARHSWITGSTGSGKTYLVIACLMQVMADRQTPVILLDLKGELTELMLEVVIPALAAMGGAGELLGKLRIVRPFGEQLPLLRITEPEGGVPRPIQAFNLASALEDALADDLGSRMTRVFLRLVSLAIERGFPLTVIQAWLEDPRRFERDARRSADPGLREYARSGFQRESRPAVDALLARLDSFLFLDEVKLALSAPRCISFAEGLESGATIVDLGSPPAGAERAQRFWSGILTGRITRAILSRPVSASSPQAWVIFEEVQEALGSGQAEQFSRLLALARHKRVSLTLINQQPGQLAAVDPTLVRVLRTNAGLECAFRCNLEDARTLAQALPVPRRSARSGEARLDLASELTQMPDREFLLWMKQAAFRAKRLRSPRLDILALRELADGLAPEERERIRRGTVAMERAALETYAAKEWERLGMNESLETPPITPSRRRSRLG